MTVHEIQEITARQREWFRAGATLDVSFRLSALDRLRAWILAHQGEIHEALGRDLGKSGFESYMCETGMVLSELRYMGRHARALSRERTVPTPLAQFCARSYVKPSPYGVALVMSPWNYPFLLSVDPLVDAVAAGNTVVLKPSAYAPHTGGLLERMAADCFDPRHVAVVSGGRAENQSLLEQKFDYIFFTGSQAVGREVLARAAVHLTPVTLELGGKSPCIVDESANLKLAARRIVFGKYLNCGQTCVAPDYVYCHREIKDRLLAEIKDQIRVQYGREPLKNPDYGRIVNEKHFGRLCGLMEGGQVAHGGGRDRERLQIEPTVLDDVGFDALVMGEEIFGPILPLLTFDTLEEAVGEVNSRPHPLALYLFTGRRSAVRMVTERCGFGGGCVNDVVIHLATSEMGFGGFGESGMGAYHGRAGFETFSHRKSIVDKKVWLDLPMRYQPYRRRNEALLRRFLR